LKSGFFFKTRFLLRLKSPAFPPHPDVKKKSGFAARNPISEQPPHEIGFFLQNPISFVKEL
jgi:hypothetical protein